MGIIFKKDGVSISGTPHGTLDAKNGVTAVDSGSDVATLALSDYPPLGDYTTTNPTTPVSGVKLFSRYRAGTRTAAQIDPDGKVSEVQAAFHEPKVGYWTAPGNGANPTSIGTSGSITGTFTTRNVATSSFFESIRRGGFVSATSAGSSAGARHAYIQFYHSTTTYPNSGYFFVARFGISQTQPTYRWWVGMTATAVLSNAEPSTIQNAIGIGQDSTDSNIQFMTNVTTTATKIDLGSSWPRPTANTEFYEFRLLGYGSDSTPVRYWSLEKLNPSDNRVIEGNTSGVSNQPLGSTLVSPQLWINNNDQAAAVAMDISMYYIETDY